MKNNHTVLVRTVTTLIFVLSVSFSASADDAFDFFVQACWHSGNNPLEIATFQADIKESVTLTIPDSDIVTYYETVKKEEKGTSQQKQRTQKQNQTQLELFREVFSGTSRSTYCKVLVKNSTSSVGLPDVPLQYREEHQDGGLRLVSCSVQAKGEYHVQGKATERSISAFASNVMNPPNRHLAGRAQSPLVLQAMKLLLYGSNNGSSAFSVAGISSFKKDCEVHQRTFTLSQKNVNYEGGYFVHILDVHEKGELRERFWVAPDRGYICPKIQIFEPSTREISTEVIAENFVFDEYSQKWFPEKISFDMAKNQREKGIINYLEVQIIPGTLVLNRPIPDSKFVLPVEEGTRVYDSRHDSNNTGTTVSLPFIANNAGEFDLSLIEKQTSFYDLEWLTPLMARQDVVSSPIEKASFSWAKTIFIVLGATLIVVALAMRFSKKLS